MLSGRYTEIGPRVHPHTTVWPPHEPSPRVCMSTHPKGKQCSVVRSRRCSQHPPCHEQAQHLGELCGAVGDLDALGAGVIHPSSFQLDSTTFCGIRRVVPGHGGGEGDGGRGKGGGDGGGGGVTETTQVVQRSGGVKPPPRRRQTYGSNTPPWDPPSASRRRAGGRGGGAWPARPWRRREMHWRGGRRRRR